VKGSTRGAHSVKKKSNASRKKAWGEPGSGNWGSDKKSLPTGKTKAKKKRRRYRSRKRKEHKKRGTSLKVKRGGRGTIRRGGKPLAGEGETVRRHTPGKARGPRICFKIGEVVKREKGSHL